jgi:hypothetical protein
VLLFLPFLLLSYLRKRADEKRILRKKISVLLLLPKKRSRGKKGLDKLVFWIRRMWISGYPLHTIEQFVKKMTSFTDIEFKIALMRAVGTERLRKEYSLGEKRVKELVRHIRKEAKNGADEKDIVEDLAKAGWSEKKIGLFVRSYLAIDTYKDIKKEKNKKRR